MSDTGAARACAAAPEAAAVPLRIGQRDCRLVCVDHVVPIHLDGGRNAHPRLVYAAGEVVHFDLDGHRWAFLDATRKSRIEERITRPNLTRYRVALRAAAAADDAALIVSHQPRVTCLTALALRVRRRRRARRGVAR